MVERKMGARRDDCPNELIIEAMRLTGGILTAAAIKLGTTRKTLHEWIKIDPELQEARTELREDLLDRAEGVILKRVSSGDFEAARYVLRCLGRHRGWIEVRGDSDQPPAIQQNTMVIAANAFDSKFAQIFTSRRGGGTLIESDAGAEGG